jgi:Tfp pilus assembly protein PilZ
LSEKRKHARARVLMEVDWGDTPACAHGGRLTSLSVGGCFVQTQVRARTGSVVFLRLLLAPEARNVLEGVLMGRVAYDLEGVGFGLEFVRLKPDDERDIRDLVEFYLENPGPGEPDDDGAF